MPDRRKVGKHFVSDIAEGSFSFRRDTANIVAEAHLDGIQRQRNEWHLRQALAPLLFHDTDITTA